MPFVAFMDIKKAYDRVDRKVLWDVCKIYGVVCHKVTPAETEVLYHVL